jgi:hypothetical protein
MPAAINKVPGGLLGFLGIKNGGENPTQLEPLLRTSVDLWPMYLASYAEFNRSTFSANIGFPSTGQSVPQGEFWWILDHSITNSAALGAGATLQLATGYTLPIGAANPVVATGVPSNVATVGQFASCYAAEPVLLLPPGASLAAIVTQIAAGPINCDSVIRYVRFPQ